MWVLHLSFIFLNNPNSKKKTRDEGGGVGVGGVVTVAGGDVRRWRLRLLAAAAAMGRLAGCGDGSRQGVADKEAAVRVAVGQRRWSSGVDDGQRGKGRVRESGVEDRIDRETRILFGFAGKIPPEKFSGEGRDAERDVNVNETFHEQTDDELSEKELRQIEADDQAIQTILLGLPEDIYAAVDS
nr:hypothetical protein [Tanacetum cinerariifolium]